MSNIYSFFIFCFGWGIRIAGLFNRKAALWTAGRKDLFKDLETAFSGIDHKKNPVIWFHASSLGEFEQGRPVIEAYRQEYPDHRILLTFFSPSGYGIRKDYPVADRVFYLPLDTTRNARRWINTVRPDTAVFIKYDFWYNMLAELKLRAIPVYYISVKFRPGQHFFRWYGGWFRRQLDAVSEFFAQNEESVSLLHAIGRENVELTGDTRFDRVFAIASQKRSFPLVEAFKGSSSVIICGSTWKEDEAILFPLINSRVPGVKFIIAPHDTGADRIRYIAGKIELPLVRHSELNAENAADAEVLLIDSVGILAQLYRYATLAYIGGGFGAGIHNIQEPVTFGVPVFFGPKYGKFCEAVDLVELGGASCVRSTEELTRKTNEILSDPDKHDRLSGICRRYVDENRGATRKIMQYFRETEQPIPPGC